MEEILHHLIRGLTLLKFIGFHPCFNHPRWCRISSFHSIISTIVLAIITTLIINPHWNKLIKPIISTYIHHISSISMVDFPSISPKSAGSRSDLLSRIGCERFQRFSRGSLCCAHATQQLLKTCAARFPESWGYPKNGWFMMVYCMESPTIEMEWNGWLGGTPIYGNLQINRGVTLNLRWVWKGAMGCWWDVDSYRILKIMVRSLIPY